MASLIAAVVGVFGALIGSFLNVVIHRVPAGLSVVSPPSSCPTCGVRIRSFDNVPVISWLVLRGRCRDCRARISVRYPVVELGTAVFFALVGLWIFAAPVFGGSTVTTVTNAVATHIVLLVAFLYLASISVALAVIDVDTHTLPNKILLPAYPVAAGLLTTAALIAGEPQRLLTALIGAGALFGLYLVLALVSKGGMGFGDVKLAGVLGLYLGYLGWAPLAVGAFGAFLLGGVFGLALLASRKAKRRSSIPFGPWMLLAAWIGIFFGQEIARGYLRLYGLA